MLRPLDDSSLCAGGLVMHRLPFPESIKDISFCVISELGFRGPTVMFISLDNLNINSILSNKEQIVKIDKMCLEIHFDFTVR